MKRILNNIKLHIYYDEINKIVYIKDNVRVRDLDFIRCELLSHGYYYKNLIIGIRYEGEY